MNGRARGVAAALLAFLVGSCVDGPSAPDPDELRQPTGLAQAPGGRWLFVTNGNWDREHSASSLVALDLDALEEGLEDPRQAKSSLDEDRPCRWMSDGVRAECKAPALIREEHTVFLGSGAGNIAVDEPSGSGGPLRLLIPTRHDPTVTWIEVNGYADDDLDLDCGQTEDRMCGSGNTIDDIEDDPSRISSMSSGSDSPICPTCWGVG